jgi:hypothetical protein
MSLLAKAVQRGRELLPFSGFFFDRPLVLLQSDDWGRCGVRDQEGLEQLQAAGLALGERPYDLYSLEAAEDLHELSALLKRHRDSQGRNPVLGMNFIVANLDFASMAADRFRQTHLLPLSEGLPRGWHRPGLLEGYREGIADGVFAAALHGTTHFCRSAVEREVAANEDRADLIRTVWTAGTPYIYWRMPWIGYEYCDPGKKEDEQFLSADEQLALIGYSVGGFAKLFSTLPRSACAPGYRANDDTHRAWAQHGIRVAQNGPEHPLPPHLDRHQILQLSRTVDFEPCTDTEFSVEMALRRAEQSFAHGIPAIVSVHSINFHSTISNYRSRTLPLLGEFLSLLEARHPDLLYAHDEDLYQLVGHGCYETRNGTVRVNAMQKKFTKAQFARQWKA